MALDIYQAVADRILEILDRGTVPWRHPIRGGQGGMPANLVSGRAYRGVNVFLLAITSWIHGYDSPHWLTYRQARERGGHVRKGEKGSLVIFWKQYATEDRKTGEPIEVPVMRYYRVFNTEQCEGVGESDGDKPQAPPPPFEPIHTAAAIVERYPAGPTIEHTGSRALYHPASDTVRIAAPEKFVDRESYYATLFHELAHSTGHSSRLNRGLDEAPAPFGSPDYSKEELVAEMGAAFLAAAAGISPPTIEQSAAYIDGWRRKISGDRKLVTQAAGAAQRAADWILGYLPRILHALGAYRKQGQQFAFYSQTVSQIRRLYGEDGLRDFMAMCDIQAFSVRDSDSLRLLAEQCGQDTIKDYSHTAQPDVMGGGRQLGFSTGATNQGQSLIRPEDIRTLPSNKQLVLYGNLPPILLDKVNALKERAFRRHLDPNPYYRK